MRRAICCLLFFSLSVKAFGQDPHFSQYFASPLSLNPANTGFVSGLYRVATNYRQQWWNVGDPYNTISASFDINFYSNNPSKNDKLGFGVLIIKDESLDGILKSTYAAISTSYHKSLSENGAHMLGIGLQLAHAGKVLDLSNISFGSQFTGKGFDTRIPVDLGIASNRSDIMDVNLGLLYSSRQEWGGYYLGASAYHLTGPVETIYSEKGAPLKIRSTVHAGTEASLLPQLNWITSAMFTKQDHFSDQLIGSALEFQKGESFKFHLGLWYRIGDSVIPYTGLEINGLSIGLNYGISTPSIATYRPRTMEISLIFRKPPRNKLAVCPRF